MCFGKGNNQPTSTNERTLKTPLDIPARSVILSASKTSLSDTGRQGATSELAFDYASKQLIACGSRGNTKALNRGWQTLCILQYPLLI